MNTNQLWQNYENPMATAQEVFLPCRKLRCNRRGNPSETIEMTHRAMCYNDLLGNSTKEVPRSLLKWQMLLRKCWYFSKLKILICFMRAFSEKQVLDLQLSPFLSPYVTRKLYFTHFQHQLSVKLNPTKEKWKTFLWYLLLPIYIYAQYI